MLARILTPVPGFGPALAALALSVPAGGLLPSPALARQEADGLPRRAPDIELTGQISGADHQTYRRAPFTMPPGVDRLLVAFAYDGREQKTVIDLGIEDPRGFRGASGGNKAHFTIAPNDATPSYLAGPLDAGGWALVLAIPNIRQSVTTDWQARIWFLRGSEAQMLPSPTAGRGPGWYRGDLHMHTGESDGSCDSQAGNSVPCPLFRTLESAAQRKLDFVAITEHNTTSHAGPLYAAQPFFDRMLLIPGREITTFFGHFNIFGVTSQVDFRIAPGTGISFNSIADRVHELGGIVSINHPALPSGEICMGCGWTMDEARFAGPVDYSKADAVEVINGSGANSADGNAEGIVSGIPFWTEHMRRGFALAPVGGSDNHDPDREGLGAIGAPLTVIEATDLTAEALFEGIRKGRSFVTMDSSIAPLHLDFAVATGSEAVKMGGALKAGRGADIRMLPDVAAPSGSVAEVYDGDVLLGAMVLPAAGEGMKLPLSEGFHPVHLRIRSRDGKLLAIGNAVRITIEPEF